MPSTLSRDEVAKLIFTREQAARVADLHPSAIDRLKMLGRLPAICDENGRLIAYFRDDIFALVGGSYRRKPGSKAKAARVEKEGIA